LAHSIEQSPPAHWDLIVALRELRNQISPDLLVRRAFDHCGYEAALSGRARANVEKFLAALRKRFSSGATPALAELLNDLADAQPEAEAPPADFADAVRLMTLHKSKGLEFPVVFLPFLHRNSWGGSTVVNCSPEFGLGVKWRDPATREPLADVAHQSNDKARKEAEEGEENRLLYVGVTRAMQRLVLSWSQNGDSVSGLARTISSVDFPATRFTIDPPPPSPSLLRAAEAPLVELSPADVGEAWESAITVTDISRYVECPRKYYLSRYLRLDAIAAAGAPDETEEGPDEDDYVELTAAELGNQVHAILAGQPPDAPAPEAVELADRFVTGALGRAAARAARQAHEWEFVFAVSGQVVRGVIDLWFERGRELVIVDYKTDAVVQPVQRERIRGYDLQLQIYAEAVRRALGRLPDRAVLAFLRTGEEVDVDLSPLAVGAALEQIHRFRSAQQSLNFPLNPGAQCYRCRHYKGTCPAEPKGSGGDEVAPVLQSEHAVSTTD
jgi:ATP-dependent exoDNAse (exonuclease V) beta subunit